MSGSKKTAARNLGGRPRENDSLRSIAERLTIDLKFDVTMKMVREWKEKGYPLNDPAKLISCLNAQQRSPEGIAPDQVKTEMALEKLLKVRAERIAKDRQNAVEAGELISLAQYMEINGRVDAEICKGLDNLADEYAPKVFGMKTIADVTVKLREATDRIKEALHAPVRTPSPTAV